MTKELDNLLFTILRGGQIKIENGQLLVAPVEIARRFGDQIRKFKTEILIAYGHCPVCAGELTVKIEKDQTGRLGRHAYCVQVEHYNDWQF